MEPYKGKNYFPVNTGHQLIYDVEHITKATGSLNWVTLHYQIKEIITGTYMDSQGRETQRIERYQKSDTTGGFVLYKVWASNLLTSTAHREEDSIRYIKLTFPQNMGVAWDGNGQNNFADRFYKYTELHVPFTLGSLTFDSTCTVLQIKETNGYHDIDFTERYATNVGMIYKVNKEIVFGSNSDTIRADIYKETLVSFVK